MNTDHIIPLAPTDSSVFDIETGKKRIAGWLARYHNFGLTVNEDLSPLLRTSLNDGSLSIYEPALNGLNGFQGSDDCEYDVFEFQVYIDNILFTDTENQDAMDVRLNFCFKSNYCIMYFEVFNDSGNEKLFYETLDAMFNAIGVDSLSKEKSLRNISWYEADRVINSYLEYKTGLKIP